MSTLSPRQSLELCDERLMAIDRWPIVQMSQTPEQKVTCPFMGGYNVNMYYPNDTELCTDSTLLMRIESECEKGEGIMFDFRQEECVPASLPRLTKQQAYCIAHWTQVSWASGGHCGISLSVYGYTPVSYTHLTLPTSIVV